ncbi:MULTISPECIES: DUF975 family protein [unclassified Lactococcus]|uniref:DUF975 family protein n=1 Tax=unclassified Lactococcus TaxID=2643510 RepID=UPI0011CCC7D5|nr:MULTISPECIES: DUF975 family protein [unclassified Lactococcus]MQW23709.1 DUF975 family protein [Lactococcus sp. dk101]TXK37541.1 DUF975 family protein [Lactococcus sp. dk310]TXK48941.1 DUF975 family protein [Lactococcus sp. dk322]
MKNSELKQQAKAVVFKEGFRSAVKLFIVPIAFVILSAIFNAAQNVTQITSNMGTTSIDVSSVNGANGFQNLLILVIGFIVSMVSISLLFTLITMFRQQHKDGSIGDDMFRVFRQDVFFKVFCLQLWRILFVTLWSLLFVIPGIIKAFAYSQSDMILFDKLENGTYNGSREIITESRQMMKGFKGNYFYMQLSFIGWYILVSITFGLVGLYVIPFYAATSVAFYENVKNQSQVLEENLA